MSMLKDFKAFALKGNVIDLAVGVIIGGAFSSIVNSVVKDLIMPLISLITGGMDFSKYFYRLGPIPKDFAGDVTSLQDLQAAGVAVLGFGNFITVCINFLILAFIIFMLVKGMSKLHLAHGIPEGKDKTPAIPEDIQLLRQIRDALHSKKQKTENSS